MTGFALGQLSNLRSTFNKADKGAIASFPNKIEVPVSQAAVHHLRLSAGQDQIIAGLADGTILVFEAKSISNKVYKLLFSYFIHMNDSIFQYLHPTNVMHLDQVATIKIVHGRIANLGFAS